MGKVSGVGRYLVGTQLAVLGAVLLGQSAVLTDVLNGDAIGDDPALLAAAHIDGSVELGETPLVGSHHILTAGELELGTTQSLNDVRGGVVLGADRHDDLTNLNTGSHFSGLAVRASHTG